MAGEKKKCRVPGLKLIINALSLPLFLSFRRTVRFCPNMTGSRPGSARESFRWRSSLRNIGKCQAAERERRRRRLDMHINTIPSLHSLPTHIYTHTRARARAYTLHRRRNTRYLSGYVYILYIRERASARLIQTARTMHCAAATFRGGGASCDMRFFFLFIFVYMYTMGMRRGKVPGTRLNCNPPADGLRLFSGIFLGAFR